MEYTLTLRDGSSLKKIKVNEQTAKQVRDSRERGDKLLNLGGNQYRMSQLQSLQAEALGDTKLHPKGTKEHVKALRRDLIDSASKCLACNGLGWFVGETARLCHCQTSVKMLYGVDPDDFNYLSTDSYA